MKSSILLCPSISCCVIVRIRVNLATGFVLSMLLVFEGGIYRTFVQYISRLNDSPALLGVLQLKKWCLIGYAVFQTLFHVLFMFKVQFIWKTTPLQRGHLDSGQVMVRPH